MKHTDLFPYEMYRYKPIYDLLPHHITVDRNTLLQTVLYFDKIHSSESLSSYKLSLHHARSRLVMRK
jgi:hypothetical protein